MSEIKSQPERPGDTVVMSFSMPRSLADATRKAARAKHLTQSALIRLAVRSYGVVEEEVLSP
jgi:hypothetical protein